MINDRGLEASVADKIGEYVQLKGDESILEKLEKNQEIVANERAKTGLGELKKLAKWAKILEFGDNVSYYQ